ncbi:MAG: hypothetical protein WAN46_08280, partial [Gammaproteobacteria bacterium]
WRGKPAMVVVSAEVAVNCLATRVCSAGMLDSSLQGCIHDVPWGKAIDRHLGRNDDHGRY